MLQCTEDFKNRLIQAMEMRGLRAVDLAKRIGVSEATISVYKSGGATPKAERLGQIAKALAVNPAWLMGLDAPMEEESAGITIGERLKQLRKARKMTQQQLADLINVAKPTISLWESGQRTPGRESLELLSTALNVDIDYLMCRRNANSRLLDDDELQIIDAYRAMNGSQKALIRDMFHVKHT